MSGSEKPPSGQVSRRPLSFSRTVSGVGSFCFLGFGTWAMLAPRSFFDAAAAFEPYNQHFVQDIGAFQIGLGAVLLLAVTLTRADALTVSLLGAGIGSMAHVISHVLGRDLGATPAVDIPIFAAISLLFLAGGFSSWARGQPVGGSSRTLRAPDAG